MWLEWINPANGVKFGVWIHGSEVSEQTTDMPALLIGIVNGSWVARVANTNISYTFAGVDLADQVTVMRGFAETMSEGNEAVGDFFDLRAIDPQIVGPQLFGTTDSIVFGGNPIYTAIGDEMIADDLEAAGEILAAFV